CMQAIQLPRTF
nr:immunoglobulin light chain junction region [Macaca mulatta]MOW73123.1 immunoglobulin light chain junction region [Macaca mulatta]MOW73913.1 immunoglobulin light chain junction region [Macaca mulatta]MOW74477.1 immunoglobulin light chain junction region [Macaca mulatta]MOW74536.1 immunoglobulin light chain junction region [Macaca mulatta]